MSVKVLPNTQIDMDDCGIFGMDKSGTFKDLKSGDFLEIKLYYTNMQNQTALPVAREIEVQCYKKAY